MPSFTVLDSSEDLTQLYSAYLYNLIPSIQRQVFFGVSYTNTTVRSAPAERVKKESWKNFHPIGNENLLLGRLPDEKMLMCLLEVFNTSGDDNDKGLVVSCNDYFELAGRGAPYQSVLDIEIWPALGIRHHLLVIPDNSTRVNDTLILETLALMKHYHAQGKPIYVHCKAGRGRSAMIMLLHLCQTREDLIVYKHNAEIDVEKTFDTVSKYLKACRSQVGLADKRNHIIAFMKNYLVAEKGQHQPIFLQTPTVSDAMQFFQSRYFIFNLIQSQAFKRLMMYLALKCNKDAVRINSIHQFFTELFKGQDNWYNHLKQAVAEVPEADNPLAKFITSRPIKERVQGKCDRQNQVRLSYLQLLKDEVDSLLRRQFSLQAAEPQQEISVAFTL